MQGQGERKVLNQSKAWFMFVFLLPFSSKFVKVKNHQILIKQPMRIASTIYKPHDSFNFLIPKDVLSKPLIQFKPTPIRYKREDRNSPQWINQYWLWFR